MMSVVLDQFFISNFGIISLLYYLLTLLLACGKEVLDWDIVFRLDLNVLLRTESGLN